MVALIDATEFAFILDEKEFARLIPLYILISKM